MAYFPWMGGAHACGSSEDDEPRLQAYLPEPPMTNPCGTARRNRVTHEIMVDGAELAHLARFFERIQDDDELDRVLVVVRAGGTLECFAPHYVYSAEVGYSHDLPE